MPRHIAKSDPSTVYFWYRRVQHYSPYASFISTLMHFEGFTSPRIAVAKERHYAGTGAKSS